MSEDRRMYRNLPPCPYCGEPGHPWRVNGSNLWSVDCYECGARGPLGLNRTDAILKYYNQHPFHTSTEIRREYRQKKAREK